MTPGSALPREISPAGEAVGRFGLLATIAESLSAEGDLPHRLATALRVVTLCLPAAGAGVLRMGAKEARPTCLASVGRFPPCRMEDLPNPTRLNGGLEEIDPGPPGDRYIGAFLDFGTAGTGLLVVTATAATPPLDDDSRQFLRAATRTLSMGIANALMAGALSDHEGVRRDMELASDVQKEFLPHCAVSDDSPIHGLNRPARVLSGDFFDFLWRDDGTISYVLGDVSGKGLNAALMMAKAASLFRYIAKQEDDPAQILRLINREIHETATRGMFVTMVAGIFDPIRGETVIANAGHEPPLLRRRDRSYATFPAACPPIGIVPEIAIASQPIGLDGGELYVFSDGLTEFGFDGGECLGVEGLVQLVEATAVEPLPQRLHTLLGELDRHGWTANDDLTVLTIDGAWVPRHG